MSVESRRPRWFERAMAAGCYVGLAPLLLRVQRRDRPFLRHHFARGLITVSLLFLLSLLAVASLGVETWVLRTPGLSDRVGDIEVLAGYVLAPPLFVLLGVSLIGLLLATLGSMRDLPLLGWAGRRRWCVRTALAGNVSMLLVALLSIGVTWHADSLAREDLVAAPVYVLIDKPGAAEMIPLAAVKVVAYPLALAARERWGEGSTVVTQLNEQSLRTALGHGRLVFIWSHGSGGGISMPDGWATAHHPDPLEPERAHCVYFEPYAFDRPTSPIVVGDDLQFVYASACYAGISAEWWAAQLAPAKIVMFDRRSGGLEHFLWLLFEAPRRVRETR